MYHYQNLFLKAALSLFLTSFFINTQAQDHMPLMVNAVDGGSSFVAWEDLSEGINITVDMYSYSEEDESYTFIESFSTTKNYFVFPQTYRSDNVEYYFQVQGESGGEIVVNTDLRPVCLGCFWDVTETWICDGQNYAWELAELKKRNQQRYKLSLQQPSHPITKSGSFEYYSPLRPYEQGEEKYFPSTFINIRPFTTKNGTAIPDHQEAWGVPQPLGPHNKRWGNAFPYTNFYFDTKQSADRHFVMSHFNTTRNVESGQYSYNLQCSSYPRQGSYTGNGGNGGGIIKTPIGDLSANPRQPSDRFDEHKRCYRTIITTCLRPLTDVDGNVWWVQYPCRQTILVPCDGINNDPVLGNDISANEIIEMWSEIDDIDGDEVNEEIDYIILNSLDQDNFTTVYFTTDVSLEDISTEALPNGVYEVSIGYNNDTEMGSYFIVDQSIEQSGTDIDENNLFSAQIYPVPNDGNYSLKLLSETEQNYTYKVLTLNGEEIYSNTFNLVQESTFNINLELGSTVPQNQLVHKIVNEHGFETIIKTILTE